MDYFTADTHISHGNIIKYCNRPFMSDDELEVLKACDSSTKYKGQYEKDAVKRLRISDNSITKMNETIINNINSIVGEDDILWHLGDVGWFRDYADAKRWRDRINCRTIYLIWGNHDEDFIRPLFTKVWGRTGEYVALNRKFQGQEVILSHFSLAVWDKQHHGSWCLYGHSHGAHEKWKSEHMPEAKSFDVGVDCWNFKPLSFTQIRSIMSKKGSGHGESV